MDTVTIGLQVSLGMLVMVVLGMRVAFAAGLAGFVGLVWLRWNGFDYDPARFWKSVQISVKVAGLTPHSKVSAQVLPHSCVHSHRVSCILRPLNHGIV